MRQWSEHRITVVVDLAAENCVHDRCCAGERHHGRLDANRRIEEEATDVGHRADARVPHIEFALIGLRVGDELLEVVGGKVLADREQFRLLGDQSDWLEILFRVIPKVRIENGRCGVRSHVTGYDGVAVGSSTRGAERAKRAARTADIFNHELLPEIAGEDVSYDPAGDIGRSAGRERTITSRLWPDNPGVRRLFPQAPVVPPRSIALSLSPP